jgi:ABC-type microcin C transport system permease subunit YejE
VTGVQTCASSDLLVAQSSFLESSLIAFFFLLLLLLMLLMLLDEFVARTRPVVVDVTLKFFLPGKSCQTLDAVVGMMDQHVLPDGLNCPETRTDVAPRTILKGVYFKIVF